MLAGIVLEFPVGPIVGVVRRRAPRPARTVRRGAQTVISGPAPCVDVDFKVENIGKIISEIVTRVDRLAPVVQHRRTRCAPRRRGRLAAAGLRPGRVVLHVGRRAVIFEDRHVVGRRCTQAREREARARPIVADLVAVPLVRRGGIIRVHARGGRLIRGRPRHGVARTHHYDPPLAVAARPVYRHRTRRHVGERPHRTVRRGRRGDERLRAGRIGRARL